jgi:hypothetical protein
MVRSASSRVSNHEAARAGGNDSSELETALVSEEKQYALASIRHRVHFHSAENDEMLTNRVMEPTAWMK